MIRSTINQSIKNNRSDPAKINGMMFETVYGSADGTAPPQVHQWSHANWVAAKIAFPTMTVSPVPSNAWWDGSSLVV